MRKHGGTPSRRDKHVTLAANSPPGVARGRFVWGHQSGLAGCKPPPLFTRRASSSSSQGRRQGEPWGASPRPSAPTYLPTYPHHCSPCFLVAKPGSTALRLVVDYGEVNKKAQNHSGSIPNMENTLERIAKCRYKTKMDKRSGFWQVDLTAAAQDLPAFITPKGRVFKWKVMPFGVANAPALFQELMNKILYILRRRLRFGIDFGD